MVQKGNKSRLPVSHLPHPVLLASVSEDSMKSDDRRHILPTQGRMSCSEGETQKFLKAQSSCRRHYVANGDVQQQLEPGNPPTVPRKSASHQWTRRLSEPNYSSQKTATSLGNGCRIANKRSHSIRDIFTKATKVVNEPIFLIEPLDAPFFRAVRLNVVVSETGQQRQTRSTGNSPALSVRSSAKTAATISSVRYQAFSKSCC